jgi:hypothetical protein
MLKLAVMLNIGVSRFTRLGFLHEIEKGDIDWRPLNSAGVNTIRIGLVVPSQRDLSPPAEQFARRAGGRSASVRGGVKSLLPLSVAQRTLLDLLPMRPCSE